MNCKFCLFVSGEEKQHTNGLPFLPLRETSHTLAFLSAYQADTTTGHIIVIPKHHTRYLEELAQDDRHALIDELVFLSGVVRAVHPASNILLNNGQEAGQHEPHLHFHVIPRELNDHLVVDSEPGSVVSGQEFLTLHQRYSALVNQANQ